MSFRYYPAKTFGELPFFCRPILIFVGVWVFMLLSLVANISESTYRGIELPVALFLLSLASFLAGYFIYKTVKPPAAHSRSKAAFYRVDESKLRKINLVLFGCVLALLIFNFVLDGFPPIAAVFSTADVNDTHAYGRLKQLLFPMVTAIFVNSFLESRIRLRLLWIVFGIAVILSYVTRGALLETALQGLFVFAITTTWSNKKVLVAMLAVMVVVGSAMNSIGNSRTTSQETNFEYLQIRPDDQGLPMEYIWVTSYFSVPMSNLCWVIDSHYEWSHTASFLLPALPSFITFPNPAADILNRTPRLIDGVHTYLVDVYLDFWFFGIIGLNAVLGGFSARFIQRDAGRHVLTYAVFMGCLSMIFFVDYFVTLNVIISFMIQSYIQKKCITAVSGSSRREIVQVRDRQAITVGA